MTCVSVGRGLAFGGDTFFSQVSDELSYHKTFNTSRVSNTRQGSRSLVIIEAGSPILVGYPVQARCPSGANLWH